MNRIKKIYCRVFQKAFQHQAKLYGKPKQGILDEMYKAAKPETNLKLFRLNAGLSQRELSELSGVPVRTIQQYEQRQKNINKAQAEYLIMLSDVLCCEVIDLMEKVQ